MSLFSKVSIQERAHFANNLAVMLKSGITIDESLDALAQQSTSPYYKNAILNISQSIKNGSLLSTAFAKEEKAFGSIFVNLVLSGEESGTLQENLVFLSDWFERAADLKREVDGATLYPKLVFGASILLGGGLSLFILPRLVPLFGQLDVELPLITKVLLAVSVFLQNQWYWCVVAMFALYAAYRLLKVFPSVTRFLHTLQISFPFIGPIVAEYQLALITQLFSTLLRSGLPITRAIEVIEEAIPNIRYKESIALMKEKVLTGKVLSDAMGTFPKLYPKMCVGIVAVGEKSGTLSDSFGYLSGYYTKEVKAKAKRLPTVIEPLLLIFIAMIVGLVALAIVLPIYKLTGSIS